MTCFTTVPEGGTSSLSAGIETTSVIIDVVAGIETPIVIIDDIRRSVCRKQNRRPHKQTFCLDWYEMVAFPNQFLHWQHIRTNDISLYASYYKHEHNALYTRSPTITIKKDINNMLPIWCGRCMRSWPNWGGLSCNAMSLRSLPQKKNKRW